MSKRAGAILSLLAVLLVIWAIFQLAHQGDRAPLYSTRRYDPFGSAALLEYLREAGHPVRTLQRPRPEPDDHGTLIQILPLNEDAPSQQRTQISDTELFDWISAGNTVIQFTRENTLLMQRCKVPYRGVNATPREQVKEHQEQEARGTQPTMLGHLVQPETVQAHNPAFSPASSEPEDTLTTLRLTLTLPARFAGQTTTHWRPLTPGLCVAGVMRVGQGRLIVVGSPTPALNAEIAQAQNLEFILAAAGDGPILIDDWSLGVGQAGTIPDMLVKLGLVPALLQIVLLIGFYHWSTRGRRPARSEQPAPRRSSAEQIETLGHLYSHSLSPGVTHSLVAREAQQRLAQLLRCPADQIEHRLDHAPASLAEGAREILDLIHSTGQSDAPLCRRCRFNLTGNTSPTCPECGAEITAELRRHIDSTPTHHAGPVRMSQRQLEHQLAAILTLSHELVRKHSRERRTGLRSR